MRTSAQRLRPLGNPAHHEGGEQQRRRHRVPEVARNALEVRVGKHRRNDPHAGDVQATPGGGSHAPGEPPVRGDGQRQDGNVAHRSREVGQRGSCWPERRVEDAETGDRDCMQQVREREGQADDAPFAQQEAGERAGQKAGERRCRERCQEQQERCARSDPDRGSAAFGCIGIQGEGRQREGDQDHRYGHEQAPAMQEGRVGRSHDETSK